MMLCSVDGELSQLSVQLSAVQCRLICQTKIGVETCGCILFILHTERSVTRTIHPNSIQKENMHNRVLASHLQLIMIDVSVRLKLRQITLISSPPIHQSGLSRWRVADNAQFWHCQSGQLQEQLAPQTLVITGKQETCPVK